MTPERRARLARPLVPAALAAAAALALAGVALAAESPAPAPSGGSAISIIQQRFQPAQITIQAGTTVTWTVTDAIAQPHSVTSGTPSDAKPGTLFDSGINLRNNGDTFSHTFDAAGTFTFFCAVHPAAMNGTITVLAAGGGSATEAESAVPTEAKLIAAAVLAIALVVLFGWGWLYRRLNPGP
jgi:plastocyanin